MPASDQALIARVIARGDQHAFSQLVLRYQSQVRVWTRRLSNGDAHLGDDLAQETFIKAHAALPRFRGEAKFSSWLYRIAFNIAASQARIKRHQWCQLDEAEHDDTQRSGTQNAVMQRDLETAMAQLSEPQQLAIRLCYEEGFSHREVADIMGIPLGTVKTHILRGKKKLESLLASWSISP